MYVDWDIPDLHGSSGVLYISPIYNSSIQELIMQGMQQKLQWSCLWCKNTCHVEPNYIL